MPSAQPSGALSALLTAVVIAVLAALCGPASADTAAPATAPRWSLLTQTTFLHLQQNQGLPNEVVASVTQDGDGFIWAGTAVGVARWDGYRFRLYRPGIAQAGVVADSYIQRVHTDPAGRVWVGTAATGLARYDRASDHFVSYPVGPNGLSHVSVRSIADDGVGGLWVGTENGLDHLNPDSGVVVRAVPVLANADSSAGLRIRDVMRDRRGRLWVNTQFGVYRRDGAEGHFVEVPLTPAEGATADADRPVPTVLFEDSDQRVWVGTMQHGAFVVDADGSTTRQVRERPLGSASGDLASRPVTSMIEVSPGEVWVGTGGGGIVAVDVASGLTRRIRNVPTLPQSLPDDDVVALYRDRSGLIWVAGDFGLSRYDPQQSAVLTMFGAPATSSLDGDRTAAQLPVPASTKITWILPTSPERIWLGTHLGEIYVVDPAGTRVSTLKPDAAHPQTALPPHTVLGMAQAPDGSVFVATHRGLYRVSADGASVNRIVLTGREASAPTWALLADGDTLWIGGWHDGLWKLDLRSGVSAQLLGGSEQRLTDNRVIALAKGPGGRLWIGTRNGLNRYEPATGELLHILPEPTRRDGLSSSFVSSLMIDKHERLWVATYGGGLNILEPGEAASNTPRFRHLSTAEGLHDDNLNSVIEDRAGDVWFSTDNGIGTVDARTGAIRSLRRSEGAAFSTYWTGSAARTAEGELLFGGAGGMTIVRPERIKVWEYSPRIVITEVRVGGKPLPAERFFGLGAGTGSAAAQPLTVDADANGLAVEFSAMDFSAPERNRYAYRLDGFDDDWIETSAARRLASYTNLPPGDYRLLLRGSNRDGVWAKEILEVPVHVLPAWHQTLWFRVAAVLATLGLLTVVVRSRTRFLREQQTELERKVQERTAELEAVSLALKEKSHVLELTSISDPLTGLRNRRFLTQHIDTEVTASLRRAHESTVGTPPHPVDTDNVFLIIDIDHFKRVNDVHGHAAGDAVLVQFAQRLQSVMRETDYVVRWGGEEFLAVARNTDRARAEELAERIRAIVADTAFTLDDQRALAVSCSIGFACLPFVPGEPRVLSWQDVVKLADVALLTAKRMGRNGWVGLYAGEAAQAEGLLARVHNDPLSTLARGEIRTASNQPREQIANALAPPEPAPAGPPLIA